MRKWTHLEPFTRDQAMSLMRTMGMGGMLIDWINVDYDLGRGVGPKDNFRCFWQKDGRRVDVSFGAAFVASVTNGPDPDRPQPGDLQKQLEKETKDERREG